MRQIAHLGAVDLIDGEAGEVFHLAGHRVALDAGEHNDVLTFLKQTFGHKIRVEAADVDILELLAGEQVGV